MGFAVHLRHKAAAKAAQPVVATKPAEPEKPPQRMAMTPMRAPQPGDRERADAVAAIARKALEPYLDFHKALAAGYQIYLPNMKQKEYHFINPALAAEAAHRFDPARPPYLIYDRLPDGPGKQPRYKLTGAMFVASLDHTEDQLNGMVPLSIAEWHTHLAQCYSSQPSGVHYPGNASSFVIIPGHRTDASCAAVGGHLVHNSDGWMTHVYPFETDPGQVWRSSMHD